MLRCAWHFVMVNMIVSFVCLIPLSVTSWARCSQVLLLAIAYSVVKWESFFTYMMSLKLACLVSSNCHTQSIECAVVEQ